MGCGASGKPAQPPPDGKGRRISTVPPSELVAIKQAFKSIDVDNSGSIEAKELETMLAKLEADGKGLSKQQREDLFNFIDRDGSGTIGYHEFVDYVLHQTDNEAHGEDNSLAKWATHEGILGIHKAAMNGELEKVKECVQAGSNVCVGDLLDVTPLHFACRCGHAEVASYLLEAKADINARTKDKGRVPLHAASDFGSVAIIEMLLNAGTPIDVKDRTEWTPLHWASVSKKPNGVVAIDALLAARADILAKTSKERTPLHLAARAGLGDVVETLLSLKADPNMRNSEYCNIPLHAAAQSGSAKATELLITAGSEKDARDRDNMTPLHWAVRGSKVVTATILVQAGADINARGADDYTPYSLAEEWSAGDLTRMLEEAGGVR